MKQGSLGPSRDAQKVCAVAKGGNVVMCLKNLQNGTISIGNHMISSAIWNKQARVNFSKTNKIA